MNETDICVTAYVVNIKDAASGHANGLLQTAMFRTQVGVLNRRIWDYPCLRAVVEYKWRHWAFKFLMFQFWAYCVWLISYTVFLGIYIVGHRSQLSNE